MDARDQFVNHRGLRQDGSPEVSPPDMAQKAQVLLDQRTIQPPLLPKVGDILGRPQVADHQHSRIPGDGPHQQENDNGDAEEIGQE